MMGYTVNKPLTVNDMEKLWILLYKSEGERHVVRTGGRGCMHCPLQHIMATVMEMLLYGSLYVSLSYG
jgi:hypothetical protein